MRDALARLWADRTPRERWIVAGGGALLGLAILYAYLWLPIAREHGRLVTDLPRLRAQADEMRAAAREVERLRTTATSAPADLRAKLSATTARRQGSRPQPQMITEANGRVRVSFAAVPAKEWQAWIAALAAERGVRIEAVQIDALDEPGFIKVSTIFSSGS